MLDPRNRRVLLVIASLVMAVCLAGPIAAQEEEAEPAATPADIEPETLAEAPAETDETPVAKEPGAPTIYRTNALIWIDGKAKYRGVIKLVFEPQGGEPVLVTININEKTKTKKITDEFVRQLQFSVGDRYKVKRSGDRKVRVKRKNSKTPQFALTIAEQGISDVSVKITDG